MRIECEEGFGRKPGRQEELASGHPNEEYGRPCKIRTTNGGDMGEH